MPAGKPAEHGFTPVRRHAEHGFTLVELMVVIVIIGLAAAIAAFNMPDPRGRVFDEGLRFAARVRAARDIAVVEARPVSLWVTSGGYGFERRVAGRWSPVADKPLRVERWEEGTRAAIPDPGGRVRLTFDPTGIADRGLDLQLSRSGVDALVRVGADGEVRTDEQ
ncbi:GspH/FimT family pseudopilin [Sphingomonas sp. 1P08PE]|uniref:GspH/FimT family pseudopilin n=1 Tax=Sphingomonas sp. 1P08PE TaxID=554122 RepID=UPI0039A0D81D